MVQEKKLVEETKLKGAYVVTPHRFKDTRGFLAPGWTLKDLPGWENVPLVQSNISCSFHEGTLRGMHYQIEPHAQAKLVRCTRGRVYDVIIDLRPESETFMQWVGVELSAKNLVTLCVPAGFAHGFQTLEENSEVFYVVSAYYERDAERGVRWDDPAFRIEWPHVERRTMNERDGTYPDFTPGNLS